MAVQHTLQTYTFKTFWWRNAQLKYKCKTIEHKDQYIEHVIKQTHSLPLQDITNIVSNKVLPVSKTTIQCWHSEAGLGSYITAKKLDLHVENIVKRLEWVMKYKDWTAEDWKHIIWSDKLSIWIGINPRRQWIIHLPKERLNSKYVKKTFKST